MLVITTASPGTGPINRPDDVLLDDQDGTRWLFDLASPLSWEGTAPVNTAVIKDVAGKGNGDIVVRSTQAGKATYSGGGWDFAPLTDDGVYVRAPASVMANLYDAYQEMGVLFYVKFPAQADWAPGSTFLPFFTAGDTAGDETYLTGVDPLSIGASSDGLKVNWAVDTSTRSVLAIAPGADHWSQIVQVAAWRQGGVLNFQMRSAASKTKLSTPAATNCAGNFAAKLAKFGIPPQGWNSAFSTFSCRKMRLYRGLIENLHTSGRDFGQVADGDWTRTIGRAVFS